MTVEKAVTNHGDKPMDGMPDVCNCNSIPENNSILEIWRLSRFLSVDSDEVQVLLQHLDQVHVAGNYSGFRCM